MTRTFDCTGGHHVADFFLDGADHEHRFELYFEPSRVFSSDIERRGARARVRQMFEARRKLIVHIGLYGADWHC
jgi:hypothetical protein